MDLIERIKLIFDTDVLIIGVVSALIFLVLREVIVWYFKINKICKTLDRIEENTRGETKNS